MNENVNPAPRRRYRSPLRHEQASATRSAILAAARELFTAQGYAATGVSQIAARAGVAVDTVYAAAGRKPALLRALVESALSGTDETVPADARRYVRQIRAATTAPEKLQIYATAVCQIGERMAPVFAALQDAAGTHPDCAALQREISERRAANLLRFAADLRITGELRADLSDDEVADIVWSTSSPEQYALLVGQRGWTPQRFGSWLVDAWTRTLLHRAALGQPGGRADRTIRA